MDEARRRVGAAAEPGARRPSAGDALVEALYNDGARSRQGGGRHSTSAIYNWTTGVAVPSLSDAIHLARVAGLSLDRLAGMYGAPEIGEPPTAAMGELLERLRETAAQITALADAQPASAPVDPPAAAGLQRARGQRAKARR